MQYLYISEMWEEDYIKYIDQLSLLDRNQPLNVIINSGWWENFLREILRDEISRFTFSLDVKDAQSNWLILLDELSSKAASIKFSPVWKHIAHITHMSIRIWDDQKWIWGWEQFKLEVLKKQESYKFGFLTKKEEKEYLKGNDIFITPDRLEWYYNKN